MSRVGKGVASGGNGATSQEESEIDLELMMGKFIQRLNTLFEERFSWLEESRSAGQAGVQEGVLEETSTQRHGASKNGVIQDTPQNGTHTLQGNGSQAQAIMKRSKYQLLCLTFATRRDRSPVVSPFGEGLLVIKHPQTLVSQKPTSSSQVVMMNFIVQLFDQ